MPTQRYAKTLMSKNTENLRMEMQIFEAEKSRSFKYITSGLLGIIFIVVCSLWNTPLVSASVDERTQLIGTIVNFLICLFTYQLFQISQKQFKQAEDSFQVQRRAYLSVESIEVKQNIFGYVFELTLLNSGDSPASEVQLRYRAMQIDEYPKDDRENVELDIIPIQKYYVPPKGKIQIMDDKAFHFPGEGVLKGYALIVFTGELLYKDVFGQKHCFKFERLYNAFVHNDRWMRFSTHSDSELSFSDQ